MKHLSFMTGAMGVALLLSGSFVTTAAAQGIPDGAQAGPATVTAKNKCSTARKAFKTNDLSFDSTTSAAFVAVPGTDIAFTTLKTGCVIVTFSGMTFAANAPVANQLMMVQAYLDGAPLAPGEVQFSGDDDEDGDGRWRGPSPTHGSTPAWRLAATL
jgi:hypothetical protein